MAAPGFLLCFYRRQKRTRCVGSLTVGGVFGQDHFALGKPRRRGGFLGGAVSSFPACVPPKPIRLGKAGETPMMSISKEPT